MNVYTIFCDGAARGNNKKGTDTECSVGVTCYKGDKRICAISELCTATTNNESEYMSLIVALHMFKHNIKDVEYKLTIHMDSKLVVEQVNGRWQVKAANLEQFANDAKRLISSMKGDVSLVWIKREDNAEADRLANEAFDKVEEEEVSC